MLETKITCDGCNEPIVGRNGYPINDYISVAPKDIPMVSTGVIYAVAMQPKLAREYHFHNINCLTKWKKIQDAQEKMLTAKEK